MVLGGGRNSALVSHADNQAAIFGHEKPNGSPLKTLKRMGGKLKHHTAVTTTEEEPGVSDSDRAAGTSVPVATKAKWNSLNAGFEPPSSIRDDASTKGGRRSFSSFRSFRSRSNNKSEPSTPKSRIQHNEYTDSPGFNGVTTQKQAKHNLKAEQEKALTAAQNSQDYLEDASKNQSATSKQHLPNNIGKGKSKKPRLANTETFFQDSEDQSRRQQMIQEHLRNSSNFRSQQPHPSTADGRVRESTYNDTKDSTSGYTNGNANGNANEGVNGAKYGLDDAVTAVYGEKYAHDPSSGLAGAKAPQTTESAYESAPQSRNQSVAAYSKADSNNNSTSDFVDAPNSLLSPLSKTYSQPSAEAAGTLSPRNRFVAGGSRTSQSTKGRNESLSSKNSMDNGHKNGARSTQGSTLVGTGDETASDLKLDSTHAPSSSLKDPRLEKQGGEDANQDKEESDFSDDEPDMDAHGAGAKDQEVNIPQGSVPGLGIGDDDPRLPGERPQAKKDPKPSVDLLTEKAKKRWLSKKEEVENKRERQAEYAGWRQIGGWERRSHQADREEAEDLLQRSTFLETYVSEKYLGDWYQNTAIIVATAFCAWLLGRMHLSLSWISLVLLFAATAYRTSVRRMRRNYRDDLLRESLLERHDDKDSESMEWLNSFMIKFWLIYEPSLSQMITEIGNEVLADSTPGFIHSMKIDKFTLGTKAPRIDFVRSFPRTNAHVVVIDMGASFTPNDTMDLTARQLQTKVNPKVQLGVRIGKGFLTKNLPVLLEDMSFKGKFRLRFKLMERFPHFQTLDFSFLSPPEFDFSLKPIGGDKFGFDINIIPGLSKFIKDIVNANLGPMMYAPNAFQVNVEQLMAGVGVSSGVGVLSLQIISASDLKRDADGRVDPYVVVMSKDKKALAHTKIKCNTTSPIWNETLHVIVTNTNDDILLEVYDFDESAPDRSIGQAPIKLEGLSGYEVADTKISSGGTKTGRLKYVASYAPVVMPKNDDIESGMSPRDTKSGILNLKIGACRDLDPSRSKTAKLSPFAEIEFSGHLIDSTKVAKHTNDPEWNYGGEHIVMDKMSTLLTLRIRDKRAKIATAPQVGLFKMKLSQLLVEAEKGNVWFPLAEGEGEIKIEPQWKPANISLGGSTNNYVEPIGVIRLSIKNAKNLRNLEHLGKIDPYARVFVGHRLVARTDWFKNELNPVWNETLYLPVQNELQSMTLEVMDVENHGKDRSLGAFRIELQNMIKQDEDGNYKVFVPDQLFTNKLMLPNRGPKGTLEYGLEFYPAIPVVSPEERDRMRGDKRFIDILKKKVEDNKGDAQKALTEDERRELASREERLDYSGVDMPVEEVLTYEAGVFAVGIVSLEGHHIGQSLKVIANNQPYPIFTSPVFKTPKRYCSEECPDFVSGQMNLSSVRFELGTFSSKSGLSGLQDVGDDDNEEGDSRDANAGELTVPCFELIREASQYPKVYEMGNGAKIELQARFFPLPGLVIDEEERIDDTGCIEIDLQRAEGVPAADRSGLSDPYCAFYMNNDGERLYKSRIKKGTLDPVWNEIFRFSIKDVKKSFVKAIVNDWDMGNRDDFLGGYKFDFADLEPLVWKEYKVPLETIKKTREVKHMKETEGTLYLRMRFLPGKLQKAGDGYLLGADSVARAAGTFVHARQGPTTVLGVGLGAAGGIVGVATAGPHALLNKLSHHGQNDQINKDGSLKSYSAQIESITGLTDVKGEIQIRLYVMDIDGDREVYRTGNMKLENGEATPNDSANFLAHPDCELGVKVLAIKALRRHSDISQSSADLKPGLKELLSRPLRSSHHLHLYYARRVKVAVYVPDKIAEYNAEREWLHRFNSDPRKHSADVDVLISTSVIQSGLSLPPEFQYMMAIITRQPMSHRHHIQAISRLRTNNRQFDGQRAIIIVEKGVTGARDVNLYRRGADMNQTTIRLSDHLKDILAILHWISDAELTDTANRSHWLMRQLYGRLRSIVIAMKREKGESKFNLTEQFLINLLGYIHDRQIWYQINDMNAYKRSAIKLANRQQADFAHRIFLDFEPPEGARAFGAPEGLLSDPFPVLKQLGNPPIGWICDALQSLRSDYADTTQWDMSCLCTATPWQFFSSKSLSLSSEKRRDALLLAVVIVLWHRQRNHHPIGRTEQERATLRELGRDAERTWTNEIGQSLPEVGGLLEIMPAADLIADILIELGFVNREDSSLSPPLRYNSGSKKAGGPASAFRLGPEYDEYLRSKLAGRENFFRYYLKRGHPSLLSGSEADQEQCQARRKLAIRCLCNTDVNIHTWWRDYIPPQFRRRKRTVAERDEGDNTTETVPVEQGQEQEEEEPSLHQMMERWGDSIRDFMATIGLRMVYKDGWLVDTAQAVMSVAHMIARNARSRYTLQCVASEEFSEACSTAATLVPLSCAIIVDDDAAQNGFDIDIMRRRGFTSVMTPSWLAALYKAHHNSRPLRSWCASYTSRSIMHTRDTVQFDAKVDSLSRFCGGRESLVRRLGGLKIVDFEALPSIQSLESRIGGQEED